MAQPQLLIALDYDKTYTADPVLWETFIAAAKQRGHSVIIATMRYPQEGAEIEQLLGSRVDTIVYTSRQAKYDEVQRQGFYPSIWVDDSPHFLFHAGEP
ncbi:MAG: hypothetical protein M3436_13585 [Pseudomonadota bacterium]|nr:hypothetical protein [Pseudomonadota bacterium]